MQTFLPYKEFNLSAKVLDNKRLGKQRVEVYQIYRTLTGETKGWRNHPAVRMWKGYEKSLLVYGIEICSEWKRRGYKDTLQDRFLNRLLHHNDATPWWLGDERLHSSHRANLLRKDINFYSRYGWSEPIDIPYYWPAEAI